MLSDHLSTLKSHFYCHYKQWLTLCSPLMICGLFWILSSLSAGHDGRAGFGICGPGITIIESVAVPAAAAADEDVGIGS